jgi:hypothetical protein
VLGIPTTEIVENVAVQEPFKPWIATTFLFERIVDAHRYLESNDQFGKCVVTV